ncbi:phage tail tape measure protein [Psychrobacillus antarcticus]|uniref:phage tail tape measure protein n=1 Tax=Psychrobacillus antarcticus TaxID=2879115 RepID=UPI0024088DF2|nr:phage tail tape measure protein [Psychrobacillus antarcticus]
MTTEIGSLAVSLSMDASNFNGSINQMNRHLSSMGSELRAAKALGADYGKSIDGLTSKKEILTRTVATSSVKLTEERRKYDELVASGTANEATLERQARRVNEAQTQYNRLTTELNEVTEELRIQSSAWTQAGERMEAVGGKMKAVGDGMTSVGKKMSMAITAPIVAAGTASVKMAADFEAQMDRVGAIAGATAGEMDALNSSALKLGADTSKSASEVAVAMEDMAAMGFNAVEIIGAMPGVISASEASGESLALAAQTVAAALNVWGLEASEASRVADVLAMAANMSAAGIDDMQLAFKYAGAPAAALGIQLEEVAAAVGIMTDAGLDGSNAGTALRASLLSLNNPAKAQRKIMKELGFSIIDTEGNAKSLSGMIGDLAKSTAHMTDADKVATLAKLVGTEAVSGFLALVKAGPTEIDKMTLALKNSGGASAETAAKMKDNLNGALEELGGTIETAAITIGNKLIPSLRKGAEYIQGMVDKFNALSPEAQKNILVMAGVAAAIGPVLVIGGTLISSVGTIITAVGTMSTAIGVAGSAFTVLAGPIGWTVAGIALLATGIGAATLAYKESNDTNVEVLVAKQKEIDANDELIESFDALQYKNQLSNEQMLRFLDINAELEMTNAPDKVAALKDEQAKLLAQSSLTNEEMDEFLGLNQKVIDGAPETVKSISLQGEAYANNTIALKELNAEKAKELQGDAYETLTIAIEKENSLLKEQKQLVSEVNEKNVLQQETKKQIGTLSAEIWKQESEILKLEEQKNGASAEEIINLDNKIRREKEILEEKNMQKSRAEEMIITYGKQLGERDKLLEINRKEIAATEEAKFKYEEIILAQVGITAERGRSGAQLSDELTKLELQKSKLKELLDAKVIGTAEYQEQNATIDTQIGKLKNAKSELQLINDVAGKTVYKDVVISENPKNFWATLDENLRRPITKNVNIRYNGTNGPQEPGYAKGTTFHPGGRFIAGEEGFELGRMGNKWEMLNLGMYNRPAGFEVFTHNESKKIIGSLNGTPGYATGARSIGAADNVINSLNRPIELKIVSELNGVISASKNVSKGLMSEVTKILVQGTKTTNTEVTAINKKANEEAKKIEKRVNEDIQQINKTAKEKKRKLTSAEILKIQRLEQDSSTKVKKINERAASDVTKINSKTGKERLDALKLFVEEKKQTEQLSLIDEVKIWESSISSFKKGTKEKVEVQKSYQKALKAIDNEILSTNKEYTDKMKSINDDYNNSVQDLLDKYNSMVDSRANSLRSFSGLFEEFTYVVEKSGSDLLMNLNSQVEGFRTWQTEMDKFAGKRVDSGLIEELREMGPRALPELLALNSLTDEHLTIYSNLYKDKTALARTQAEKELSGMKKDTEERITELRNTANTELEKLRVEWVNKIKSITKASNDELLSLKQIGVNAGKGLLEGLASMEPALIAKSRSIANSIQAAMKSALQVKSPSRVTMGIGKHIGEGLIIGMEQMNAMVENTASKLAQFATPSVDDQSYGASVNRNNRSGVLPKNDRPIVINVISHLDGQEVARNQVGYINGMQYNDSNISAMLRGVRLG